MNIPSELLCLIYGHLDTKSLLLMSLVDKSSYEIISSEYFWKNKNTSYANTISSYKLANKFKKAFNSKIISSYSNTNQTSVNERLCLHKDYINYESIILDNLRLCLHEDYINYEGIILDKNGNKLFHDNSHAPYIWNHIKRAGKHFCVNIHNAMDSIYYCKIYLYNSVSCALEEIPIDPYNKIFINSDDGITCITKGKDLCIFDFNGKLLNKIKLLNYIPFDCALKSNMYVLYNEILFNLITKQIDIDLNKDMLTKIKQKLKNNYLSILTILDFNYPIIIGIVGHYFNYMHTFVFNILTNKLKTFKNKCACNLYEKLFVIKKNKMIILYDLNTMEKIDKIKSNKNLFRFAFNDKLLVISDHNRNVDIYSMEN